MSRPPQAVPEAIVVSDDDDVVEVTPVALATKKQSRPRSSHADDELTRKSRKKFAAVVAALGKIPLHEAERAAHRARIKRARGKARGRGCVGPRFLIVHNGLVEYYSGLEEPPTVIEIGDEYTRLCQQWGQGKPPQPRSVQRFVQRRRKRVGLIASGPQDDMVSSAGASGCDDDDEPQSSDAELSEGTQEAERLRQQEHPQPLQLASPTAASPAKVPVKVPLLAAPPPPSRLPAKIAVPVNEWRPTPRTPDNMSARLRAVADQVGVRDQLDAVARRGILTCRQYLAAVSVVKGTGLTIAGEVVRDNVAVFFLLKLQKAIRKKNMEHLCDDARL